MSKSLSFSSAQPVDVQSAIAGLLRSSAVITRAGIHPRLVKAGDGQPTYEKCALREGLEADLKAMQAAVGDEALRAAARKLQDRARAGDGAAQEELNAIQLRTSNNFLVPQLGLAAAFFEVWTLVPGDRPYWQNETKQQVNLSVVGSDGAYNMVKSIPSYAETLIPMKEHWTDDVRYPLRDPNNPEAMHAAMANIDLARDSAAYADELAFGLLKQAVADGGVFGDFTLTGSKVNRVYLPHTRIRAANLPTTNDITLNAGYGTAHFLGANYVPNTTSTAFRKDVFDAAIAYQTQWGGVFGGDMDFTGEIFLSSLDVASIGANLALEGAQKSNVAEDIQQNGFSRINYQGRIFTLIGRPELEPGACYLPFRKKTGVMLLMPSLDAQDVKRNVRENWESRAQGRRMGFYFPQHHRPFALKITFRTAS